MRIATPGPGLVLATAVLTLAACGGSGAAELENGGSPTGDLDGRRPSGVVLAASGFDVATNGFSFENYGNEAHPLNLDSTSMVTLFGDQVCAGKVKKGGGCKPRPHRQEVDGVDERHHGRWALFRPGRSQLGAVQGSGQPAEVWGP